MKPKNETKIEALYYYIGANLPKKKAMAYRKNSTIISISSVEWGWWFVVGLYSTIDMF